MVWYGLVWFGMVWYGLVHEFICDEISMLFESEKVVVVGDIAIIATSSGSRSLRVLRLFGLTWRCPGPELDNMLQY